MLLNNKTIALDTIKNKEININYISLELKKAAQLLIQNRIKAYNTYLMIKL